MSPEVSCDNLTKLCNGLTHRESKDISIIDLKDEPEVPSTIVKPESTPVRTSTFFTRVWVAPNVGFVL